MDLDAALLHAAQHHSDRIPGDLRAQVHRLVEDFHLLAASGQEFGHGGRLVIVFLGNHRNALPGARLAQHDVPALRHVRQVDAGNIVGHARDRARGNDHRLGRQGLD